MANKLGALDIAKKFISSNTPSLRNTIATLLVLGIQVLITTEDLFKCPAKGNVTYGCMFIFMPALVLFVISLLLSDSFKKATQGCRYTKDLSQCLTEEVLKVLFYGLMVGFLWISWALLKKDYYTCVAFGSKDQMKNVTEKNKIILEKRYQKAQSESQIFGFTLLVLIVGIPLLFMTIRRCCCLRPATSGRSPYDYEKLEAEAAEKKLDEIIEGYAKTQGEGKAERQFAQNIKAEKSVADILHEARADLSSIEGNYDATNPLEENKKVQAEAFKVKFKEEVEELVQKRVNLTLKEKALKEYEGKNPYDFVEKAYESMKITGNQSKPSYKHIGERGGIEMGKRHDEA